MSILRAKAMHRTGDFAVFAYGVRRACKSLFSFYSNLCLKYQILSQNENKITTNDDPQLVSGKIVSLAG